MPAFTLAIRRGIKVATRLVGYTFDNFTIDGS